MAKGRLEAFSDGVLAIIITIMVLELRPPHEATLEALQPLWPTFSSYVLSFVYLAIYWNNHHHLMQATRVVSGRVLWANVHLLFWLSLFPFATAWVGETTFASVPVAIYATVFLAAALAYAILVRALVAVPGQNEALAEAVGRDRKGIGSIVAYAVAIPLALVLPLLAVALIVGVAAVWFVPDRRMERALGR
ncbi:MAG TPA: TMEM175 family protein [Candidatus Limnocylindrales bacterium]|nr:TMEM175 family protein [Candidatus Limnocylindrales bacterium]